MLVFMNMVNLAMLLSVSLGVMNLLPLPALDGGRLVFLFLEVLRGKPIPPEKEGVIHFAGFVALMVLMVFVMFNDIQRIIGVKRFRIGTRLGRAAPFQKMEQPLKLFIS